MPGELIPAQLSFTPQLLIDPMAVLGAWAIDGDGARTNGGGLVGATPTLTVQGNSRAQCDDGGVFKTLAGVGYNATYQMFPDAPANNDAVYFGAASQFCELAFDIDIAQASIGNTFTWEYWNGATWGALTIVRDGTSAASQTGSRSFEQDGAIAFVPPANWAQNTVEGVTVFWVRCRVTTFGNIGVALGRLNTTNHEVVTPNGGYVVPHTGRIDSIRLVDNAGTLHTTADVKFILMNFTSGEHSGELTFSMDLRAQRFTGLTLDVTQGDVLGVLVTQEDTGAEPAGVVLELGVTLN